MRTKKDNQAEAFIYLPKRIIRYCRGERAQRNHRLCSRGGFIESVVPELITMPDERLL
jgi:hypothetical protein